MQLALPGVDPPRARTPRRRPRPSAERGPAWPADDPLLASFARRLASHGRARKGQLAYLYQMRSMLTIAARLTGRATTCAELVRDEGLLGRVLVDDVAPTLGIRVSRWTLAQRRSTIRDFASLMRPELRVLFGEEPHDCLDRALRAVAERVGAGYRLGGGAPRRRGGRAPTDGQIRNVLDAVGRAPGYVGARNRAFFTILAESGARVNALRVLDGTDCVALPPSRLRIFLHEKGKAEPREVELSRAAADALRAYAEAFNYLAATRRRGARVGPGKPGPVWRNSPRGRWSTKDIQVTLRAGCAVAEVPPFTPHALRRAFATDAASVLPRHTVAQAGGWAGLERLDNHYVQPRGATIRKKLSRTGHGSPAYEPDQDDVHEPAPLFSAVAPVLGAEARPHRPDPDSGRLLGMYQDSRLAQGAHPRSVQREVSQLRAVMREAGTDGRPAPCRTLFADLDLLARVLCEPQTMISRSTGRARLLAVQRFIQIMGPTLGRDPAADLAALDARLPTRRTTGWHATGTLVAGTTGRRRRRGPTLDAGHLRRIADAVGTGGSGHAPRDRALVALHCFSGLRPEEIIRLRWEDLATELTAIGYYGVTATLERNGRRIRLMLPGPASEAVEALAGAAGGTVESLSGPVLCARGAPDRPLSYRAARDVLQEACRRAGLPTVDSASLRAACAHWLRTQGLSDHEVAAVLGLARVRSLDRLLRRHAALDAQRAVREALVR